eukprot:1157812-Pelagomonas_calceolata.AAC.9
MCELPQAVLVEGVRAQAACVCRSDRTESACLSLAPVAAVCVLSKAIVAGDMGVKVISNSWGGDTGNYNTMCTLYDAYTWFLQDLTLIAASGVLVPPKGACYLGLKARALFVGSANSMHTYGYAIFVSFSLPKS